MLGVTLDKALPIAIACFELLLLSMQPDHNAHKTLCMCIAIAVLLQAKFILCMRQVA